MNSRTPLSPTCPPRALPSTARAKGLVLSLVGAAAVALSASPAEAAECSDGVRTALQLATVFSGAITLEGAVGGVPSAASAGFALAGMLACDDGEPLDEQAIVDRIREEISDQAADVAGERLPFATARMRDLAADLQDLGDIDLASIDSTTRDNLRQDIADIEGHLDIIVSALVVPLRTPVNSRTSYDLSDALTFAHYQLALARLGAQLDGGTDADETVVDNVLSNIEDYQVESDRLRGISVGATNASLNIILIPQLQTLGTATFRRSGENSAKEVAITVDETTVLEDLALALLDFEQFALIQHAASLFGQLDAQNAQLSLLRSRALALDVDPFSDFASVVSVPETSVMLKNIHPQANNRCLFNRVGYRDLEGELKNGATRTRECVPADSQQQWILEDNGQIRSAIADLCLTAKADNKVLIEPCNDLSVRQLWTRDGNRFKVDINGVVTCLAPGIGGINSGDIVARHMTCDDTVPQQEWLVFSQLRSGSLPQIGAASVSTLLDVEGVTALANTLEEEASGGLCLDSSATLRPCDRLDSDLLWAQDAQGRLQPFDLDKRPLSFNPELPDEISTDFGLTEAELIDAVVTPLFFERFEVGPGFVTFALAGTNDLLFPGAFEEGSELFVDVVPTDENGAPILFEDVFWRHFNGGKFAS